MKKLKQKLNSENNREDLKNIEIEDTMMKNMSNNKKEEAKNDDEKKIKIKNDEKKLGRPVKKKLDEDIRQKKLTGWIIKDEKMNKEVVDEIKDEKNVNDEKDDEKKDEYDDTMKNGNKQTRKCSIQERYTEPKSQNESCALSCNEGTSNLKSDKQLRSERCSEKEAVFDANLSNNYF